tara:strand:- start:793 stop:5628 length:4836 start_codon:yes stop_codon:yes gene_type:complete
MAEIKNSFLKGKMNQDLDSRILPKGEYREANNLSLSRSEGSDVGALESILGNLKIGNTNDTNTKIIGYFVDDSTGFVYYFRTDHHLVTEAPANSLHQICSYNSINNTISVLVEGSWLNFSSQNQVIGLNLIERLLFFTDNRNQPRKINIEKPLSYYTNEDQISVAKFAPVFSPEYINLRSNLSNNYTPSLTNLPSTMTNASDLETVPAGIYEVSDSNLGVKKYANGDPITEAQTLAGWNTASAAGEGCFAYYDTYIGNEITYGILYNKYAVIDPRGLAPVGFSVPSDADWAQIISTSGVDANSYKSTTLWATIGGTDANGLNIKPAGIREAGATDFSSITTETRFWTSSAVSSGAASYVAFDDTNTIPVTTTANVNQGYSVRVIKDNNYNGWNGDPELIKDKFVKFSYRFKFDDNEYSVIAPFSQDVFIPEQQGEFVNDDETQAFVSTVVEFMQNSINNAVLNIKLPCIDIINKYKIKGIEIIFTESDRQAYQVLEKIKVNSDFIASLNYTNIYQYSYQSTKPINTLPAFETTRVYDKVPVRALAQESVGNRILYSNYAESYDAPLGLDYHASVENKDNQQFIEYPQHSLKQNRNYQVGVVLADKYGRQTDIILSNYDGLLDVNGDPQPGSNVYSDYNTLQFTGNVASWPGDTLAVNFQHPINTSNYAESNYYSVDFNATTGALDPFFESDSYHYFTSTGVTNFVSVLSYADATSSSNTLNVFVNEGNGWVLKELTTDYIIVDTSNKLQVNFLSSIPAGFNVKIEILFSSEKLYKYRAGSGSTSRPLFANFATTYQNYFAAGRKLSGQYIDYTEIITVTPNLPANATEISLTTKEEIAVRYLFSYPAQARPEPTITPGTTKTFATYKINVNGFYTYRLGVKQQQQDYYNVYLPGIVNGYPLNDSNLEQGETGFITLVSDNINKVPRNLQEVGPLQNQFTSDESMFPRVVNMIPFGTSPYITKTKQFDPSNTPDSVDLVGTVEDVFPELTTATTTGDVNPSAIYDFDTKPYIAKLSTQKPIGLTENLYEAPIGSAPYPANLSLAVYETSPFVSQLELFYETSSAQLISDLNIEIQNEGDEINGSTFDEVAVAFSENDAIGTILTGDFFPTVGGQIVTDATCSIINIYSYDPSTQAIDASINYNTRFAMVSGASTGSVHIKTAAGPNDPTAFYAGGVSENLYNVSWRGRFEITLRWSRGGINTNETVTIQLQNDDPVVSDVSPIISIVEDSTTSLSQIVMNNYWFGFGTQTNAICAKGANGSAADPLTDPAAANWTVFDTQNYGWSLEGAKYTDTTGTSIYYGSFPGSSGSTNPIANIAEITAQSNFINLADSSKPGKLGFTLTGVKSTSVANAGSYDYYMKLTDNLGASTFTTVGYTVGAASYWGWIVNAPYSSGTGFTGNSNTSLDTRDQAGLPVWQGQIQNWNSSDVWIWMRASIASPSQSLSNFPNTVEISGFGSDALLGTGTVGNISTGYGIANTTSTHTNNSSNPVINGNYVLIARLKGFNPSNAQKAEGVYPGQKSDTSSTETYDWQESAIVNAAFEMTSSTSLSGNSYGLANLGYTTSNTPPTFSFDVLPFESANVTPPFYPINGASTVWTTTVPSGGFLGADVP